MGDAVSAGNATISAARREWLPGSSQVCQGIFDLSKIFARQHSIYRHITVRSNRRRRWIFLFTPSGSIFYCSIALFLT